MYYGLLTNSLEFATPFSLIKNAFDKLKIEQSQSITELKRELNKKKRRITKSL